MRLALLSSAALCLVSSAALAAAPAKTAERAAESTSKSAERVAAREEPSVSTAEDDKASDGTAAAEGAKGIVFGVNALPTVGGFLFVSPVDSLRLNLGFIVGLKPDVAARLSVDAVFRHHLTTGTLRPFAEGGLEFAYDGDIDFGAKAGLGVEYFFVPRVSVAGTLGLALRFENGGSTIGIPFGTTGLLMNVFF
ncbi:hypothetical protein [Archangium primigenium]|uniref:hypothetical protein n=1 Tax=[Archangium] primigenium TaxID=2792470 RepID=UPI00195D4CCF|nr:hypothetical protein [Archangium primigenium]MBM7115996.1 hypothetical protein [Archangium primigenium]